jgi:hypothetical protein
LIAPQQPPQSESTVTAFIALPEMIISDDRTVTVD